MLKNQIQAVASSQLVPSAGAPMAVLGGDKQYAVLLLNEEQLGHIMQRPGMRQVNRRGLPAGDAYAAYTRLKRRTMAGVGALVVVVAAGVLWAWAPVSALASVFPWSRPDAPTVSTGASFSLTVGPRRSAGDAAAAAGRLLGLGIPAFTRSLPDTRAYQVMVGPYVSLDEAERQQRRLSGHGFGGARMFVDESLRDAPRNTLVATAVENPGIVLVGASDRLSLVLEMSARPRQVSTRRVGDTALQVDIGPFDAAVGVQQWTAPEGVRLIEHVAIEETSGASAGHYARARIALPESARATTRVEGRRVYVDISRAPDGEDGAASAAPRRGAIARVGGRDASRRSDEAVTAPAAATSVAAPRPVAPAGPAAAVAAIAPAAPAAPAPAAVAAVASGAAANEPLRAVVSRLHEVMPFVMSAVKSPSPEILGALTATLASLEGSLRELSMTGDAGSAHAGLLSAAASARQAVDSGFTGDRIAEAHKAAALFESAKARVH